MTEEPKRISTNWLNVRAALLDGISEWYPSSPEEPLTLPTADDDWLIEVSPDGMLSCQVGYQLDDMRSLLSDGTAEDLGSDELAKQTKFYLQQTVSKHRRRLEQEGFTERVEFTEDYVALVFEKNVDAVNAASLIESIRRQASKFSASEA